jgi:hypothetical protein
MYDMNIEFDKLTISLPSRLAVSQQTLCFCVLDGAIKSGACCAATRRRPYAFSTPEPQGFLQAAKDTSRTELDFQSVRRSRSGRWVPLLPNKEPTNDQRKSLRLVKMPLSPSDSVESHPDNSDATLHP